MEIHDLSDLLRVVVEHGASDLHLAVGVPPALRVNGAIQPLGDRALTSDETRGLILGVLTETQRARLEEEWELDFAVHVHGVGRFRGNAHFSRGALEGAFRHISEKIPDLQSLGHRPSIRRAIEDRKSVV